MVSQVECVVCLLLEEVSCLVVRPECCVSLVMLFCACCLDVVARKACPFRCPLMLMVTVVVVLMVVEVEQVTVLALVAVKLMELLMVL